jgi:hypothetical protein
MFGLVKESRFKELKKEYDDLFLRLDNCRRIEAENNILKSENQNLNTKIVEINKKIREQIEADLYFISAKIQKKLLDGETKEQVNDLRLQQMALQANLAQQWNLSPYPGLASIFGSLGSGLVKF